MTIKEFIQNCREVEVKSSKSPWHVGHISEVEGSRLDIDSPDRPIAEDVFEDEARFIIFARNNWLDLVTKLEEALKVIEFYAKGPIESSDPYCTVFEGWNFNGGNKRPIEHGQKAREFLERDHGKD